MNFAIAASDLAIVALVTFVILSLGTFITVLNMEDASGVKQDNKLYTAWRAVWGVLYIITFVLVVGGCLFVHVQTLPT